MNIYHPPAPPGAMVPTAFSYFLGGRRPRCNLNACLEIRLRFSPTYLPTYLLLHGTTKATTATAAAASAAATALLPLLQLLLQNMPQEPAGIHENITRKPTGIRQEPEAQIMDAMVAR